MRGLLVLLILAAGCGPAPEPAGAATGDPVLPAATLEQANIECVDFGYVPLAEDVRVYPSGLIAYTDDAGTDTVVFDHCRVSPPPTPTTP